MSVAMHDDIIRTSSAAARLLLSIFLLVAGAGVAEAAPRSHLGGNQKVMVLCVRFSDLPGSRKATCQDWVDTLNFEVNRFFLDATRGATSFEFVAPTVGPADGWFAMSLPSTADFFLDEVRDEVMPLAAAAGVDFTGIDRFLVISNSPAFFGYANGPYFQDWPVAFGVEGQANISGRPTKIRTMTGCMIHEWEQGTERYDAAVLNVIHELGHSLGSRNHYANGIRAGQVMDALDHWTIMGRNTRRATHFTAWDKSALSWLPATATRVIGPPSLAGIDETVTIHTSDLWSSQNIHQIVLPFNTALATLQSKGYSIEARRYAGEDDIHGPGIVIAAFDATGRGPGTQIDYFVERDPSSSGSMSSSALEVGDVFTDPVQNLTILHVSNPRLGEHVVRIRWGAPLVLRPDPLMFSGKPGGWDSPDLWIDSERNGWGNYRRTTADGRPAANGDDPWVSYPHLGTERRNRVYARIHNGGPGTATDVPVTFYWADAALGQPSSGWQIIERVVVPSIPPNGFADVYANWIVLEAKPVSIAAVIEALPDELSTRNNTAQESIWTVDRTRFEVTTGTLRVPVAIPRLGTPTRADFIVQNLPPGWTYELSKWSETLEPGSEASFEVSARPEDEISSSSQFSVTPGFVAQIQVMAVSDRGDTREPIGGGEIWTHVVESTALSCVRATNAQGTLISGRLSPAREGEWIAVEVLHGGRRLVQHAKTDREGAFLARFDVVALGRAEVSFSGRGALGPADSVCP